MDSSEIDCEQMVLGILLNDDGSYGFMKSCRMSLRKELFKERKNAFVYEILDAMYKEGRTSTTPLDVYEYAEEKGIRCGSKGNFASYLCELSSVTWRFDKLKTYVRQLVVSYIKERKING